MDCSTVVLGHPIDPLSSLSLTLEGAPNVNQPADRPAHRQVHAAVRRQPRQRERPGAVDARGAQAAVRAAVHCVSGGGRLAAVGRLSLFAAAPRSYHHTDQNHKLHHPTTHQHPPPVINTTPRPRWRSLEQAYEALPLGKATAGTGSVLDPDQALSIQADLDKALCAAFGLGFGSAVLSGG